MVRVLDAGLDVGITARDPGQLVEFYGGFLGLPLARHVVYPSHGAEVWFFRVGNGHLKVLGFDKPPAAMNPPGGNQEATGYRYLALQVDSIEAVLDEIGGAGGSVQRPPEDHGQSRVVFVSDPEGNCIEFVETLGGAGR